MVEGLPALPSDSVLATIGRFATRYPRSGWLDALARRASQGTAGADELLRRVRQQQVDGLDRRDLAWFGYIAAADPSWDLEDVLTILDQALAPTGPPDVGVRVWSLYLQALHLAGRRDPDRVFGADRLSLVDPQVLWAVQTDALNPFRRSEASMPVWLEALSRPFTTAGAAPLRLTSGGTAPFDRLTTAGAAPGGGDLVSVILPVFNPDQSLVTSARSILAQTWRSLELLLCDDGSTSGRAVIDEVAALDDRVRVLRSEHNAGTYSARNRGLTMARGRYLTFQDADDFSHAERIERQVAVLQERGAIATLSHSVRASTRLELTALGRSALRVNLSSLLFDGSAVLPALGGFDSVRKAADTEFVRRIEARFSPASVTVLAEPLAVVQTRPDSLSRNDFGMLRRSPAREAYRVGFEGWHAQIASGAASARLERPARAPFPAPAPISGVADVSPGPVDLVLLANPMASAPVDLGRIVQACSQAGLRLAVVEYFGADDVRHPPRTAGTDLARAVAEGTVHLVLPGEKVTAPVAVMLDSEAALLMPAERLRDVQVERLFLVAPRIGESPSHRIRARAAASGIPHVAWLPTHEAVADALRAGDPDGRILAPMQWHVVAGGSGAVSPPPSGSRPPVVGMVPARGVSGRARRAWIDAVVPRAPGIELRRLGRGPAALAHRPVVRVGAETGRDTFLDELDYLLAPPLPRRQLTELVVAAWARGVVVLAEEAMYPLFADAALYPRGEPDALINQAQVEPEVYRSTQQAAASWVRENATPDALVRRVRTLLCPPGP